jgi:SAM-dependent methyltransferase
LSLANESLYALPQIRAVLREELGFLREHAARQPAGRALLLRPHATTRDLDADVAHLAATELHVERDRLGGDVACTPGALPFEDAAFQLVLAQHAGDALPDEAFAGELARVLAPGGVLLWNAFNPWSPWLAWIHWQTRRVAAPQFANAQTQRRRFLRAKLTPVSLRYVGACWPSRRDGAAGADGARSRLLTPLRGAYLLVARKQHAALIPMRPRRKHASVAFGARLAGTPSQRASA